MLLVRSMRQLIVIASIVFTGCNVEEATVSEPVTTDAKETSTQHSSDEKKQDSELVKEELFAKVGPDEAFFAWIYLKEVLDIAAKEEQVTLALSKSESGLSEAVNYQYSSGLNAFDFAANFSDDRLTLMISWLMHFGDANGDGLLSVTELAGLSLDPQRIGAVGETYQASVSLDASSKISGNDDYISTEEMEEFLKLMGPQVEAARTALGDHEYRLKLLKTWDSVLSNYDLDKDGHLGRAEYVDLRDDRQQKVAIFLR